ncbi:metallophosphoesterase [Coleofasciculus sp. FACHB-1120]|uniref:metallophosphoesterase n=1 Tax=Coleofasciculus sp. FACHB-1120 TaxID=2692783 RepID=UPI001684883B|nr:metallophosphoesterase [Coleofasciculus sp. FACHB-1120]MBD2744944.1 metallophosphoesterase [Coleofasciculus sp. FACHB-1120]
MNKIKYTLLGLLGIFCLILFWGLLEPYLIDTEEEVAEIPGLPASWEGQRVALIADWQIGMWMDNTSTIRRIVKQLIEERPAIVLIAGDFIHDPGKDPSEEINKAVEIVRSLPLAGIPTYAVLGNHDYAMKNKHAPPDEKLAAKLHDALESVGVQVLQNEAVAIGKTGGNTPLYLVGIGAHWSNNDKPKVALAPVPEGTPRLVMMHNPDSFEALPPNTAPLAVAGHTHGGQFRLPFTPEWSWMTFTKEDEVHADGWIKGYGQPGNRLYVNRGIGFSIIPIRLNCPPEVTLFTLQSSL